MSDFENLIKSGRPNNHDNDGDDDDDETSIDSFIYHIRTLINKYKFK